MFEERVFGKEILSMSKVEKISVFLSDCVIPNIKLIINFKKVKNNVINT